MGADLQFLDLVTQCGPLDPQQLGSFRLISAGLTEDPDDDSALDCLFNGLERFGDMVAELIRQVFDNIFSRLSIPAYA